MSRPGDWHCPNGHGLQFASRTQCRNCGELKPADAADAFAGGPGGFGGGGGGFGKGGGGFGGGFGKGGGGFGKGGGGFGGGKGGKPGDWMCPNGHGLQFASRTECRNCGEPKPADAASAGGGFGGGGGGGGAWGSGGGGNGKPGDWMCPKGHGLQFASRTHCRNPECGEPKPADAGVAGGFGGAFGGGGGTEKPGDWMCPNGHGLQFASRTQCRNCGEPKPPGSEAQNMQEGDWMCPRGHGLQFASRSACRDCGSLKPID
ncbi:RNA-binding protein cabeza [Diplonema papillatum]|nr:RNA-binding protein cabeza [Diplonema papillatum]